MSQDPGATLSGSGADSGPEFRHAGFASAAAYPATPSRPFAPQLDIAHSEFSKASPSGAINASLRMITSWLFPTAAPLYQGVRRGGADIIQPPPACVMRAALFPHRTVAQPPTAAAGWSKARSARIDELVALLSLDSHCCTAIRIRSPAASRRVAIARAIAADPPIFWDGPSPPSTRWSASLQ
jgi:hypothetical protein